MKAIRQHVRGGPEQLVYEDAPLPDPAAGEALLRVYAAGITPTELTWSERLPTIPGHDVSGVVEALGPGVSDVSPGDAVYGLVAFPRDEGLRGVRQVFYSIQPQPIVAQLFTDSHARRGTRIWLWGGGIWLGLLHRRRHRGPSRAEDRAAGALNLAAQQKPLAVLLNFHHLQTDQILDHIGPLEVMIVLG